MENRNRRNRNRHREPPLLLRYLCKFLGWFLFFASLGFKFYKSPIHHKILELSKHGDHDLKIAVEKEDDVYRQSLEAFKSEYADMVHNLKIYVYPTYSDEDDDGDGQAMKYANRGEHGCAFYFYKNLLESSFMTDDPDEAHLFFVPLSNHIILQQASSANESAFLGEDYMRHIISAYPHWNATFGSDHFFITCDEIDVRATENIQLLIKNSTRLMCSPTYKKSDGNNDVSIPSDIEPYKLRMEVDVTASRVIESLGYPLPENKSYFGGVVQRGGRYCVCLSSGSIPTSNCIVGAIDNDCVPVVLLADYYDLPLGEVLDWRKFSAIVRDYQVPFLRRTVLNNPKSDKQYKTLHQNLSKVKHHFKWNSRAERYDAFHMALYNLWMRRKKEVF